MPAGLVGDLIEQATVRLFQHDFLQLFKPRSVVRSKVEFVGFHQTEISDDKQFGFHATLTSICFGLVFSLLGRWTFNTPSLNSAFTFSASAPSGRTKLRTNL